MLGRRCKDLVSSLIAEPNTPSFSIAEADVADVVVGEEDLANLARPDPVRDPLLARQHRRIRSPRGNAKYGRRVSLDGGRLVASLATQEAEYDGDSDRAEHAACNRGASRVGGTPDAVKSNAARAHAHPGARYDMGVPISARPHASASGLR